MHLRSFSASHCYRKRHKGGWSQATPVYHTEGDSAVRDQKFQVWCDSPWVMLYFTCRCSATNPPCSRMNSKGNFADLFAWLFRRHSTMLVGQTGSGKSVCWKILQASMTRMKRDGDSSFNVVRVRMLKSVTLRASLKTQRQIVETRKKLKRAGKKNTKKSREGK